MPHQPSSARPILLDAGVPDTRLSSLMRSVRIDHAEEGVSRLEVCFGNHAINADGEAGPVFGTHAPLRPGSAIELVVGDPPALLFAGQVHRIEHVHDEGSAPDVVVHAADARQARHAPAGADLPLSVGGTLLSARVIEASASVRIEGVNTGDPAIRVGRVVAVRGLAPQLATRYRVVTVTHSFEPAQGMRTAFTGASLVPGQPT